MSQARPTHLVSRTAKAAGFKLSTSSKVVGTLPGITLDDAVAAAVNAAYEEGLAAGQLPQAISQHEAGMLAWRAGAKFGMLALAKQDVAFLTDSMQEAAVKVAVDLCVAERDRLLDVAAVSGKPFGA